ncbi:hypothetical protein TGRH88_055280 [Toxoplasma gondii]|uniref:Uncharacterized protein n=4 Tax=Toxoplasma gondii TaxID=5811 RepID=A0A3R7YJD4_TOXGO|nr:hypothetical protein TGRH88_055280 [Toxoplasma gondii]RQX67148.1 hypothetical protein TGCAST_316570 [Toxoplasma gondii CAST]
MYDSTRVTLVVCAPTRYLSTHSAVERDSFCCRRHRGVSCSSQVPPSTRSCQNSTPSPANHASPSFPVDVSPAAPTVSPASVSPSVPGVSPSPFSPRASLSPYSLPRPPSGATGATGAAALGVPVLVSGLPSRPVSPASSLEGRGQAMHFSSGRQGRPRYATAPSNYRHARALQPSDLRVRAPRLSPSPAGASPRLSPSPRGPSPRGPSSPALSPSLSFERHRRQQTTFERLRQELKTTYFPRVAASDNDDWETFRAQMIEESERERRQNLQKEEFETLSPRERVMIPTMYLHPQEPHAPGGDGDSPHFGGRADRHYFSLPPVLIAPADAPSEEATEAHTTRCRKREETYHHQAERPAHVPTEAEREVPQERDAKEEVEAAEQGDRRTLSPASSVVTARELRAETPKGEAVVSPVGKKRERTYSVAPAARETGTLAAVVQQKKNALHKRIWNALRKKKFRDFEHAMAEMEAARLRPDEVSFTLHLYGVLLSSRHDNAQAWEVLNLMKASKVHPTLVRYNERILTSYMELAALKAEPHPDNTRKLLRAAWLLAALVRNRRQRWIARKNASLREQGVGEEHLLCLHDLGALWIGNAVDPLLPRTAQFVMIEERLKDQNSGRLSASERFPLLSDSLDCLDDGERGRQALGSGNGGEYSRSQVSVVAPDWSGKTLLKGLDSSEQHESREAEIAALAAVAADVQASVQPGALAAAGLGAAETLNSHPLFSPRTEGRGLTAEFSLSRHRETEPGVLTAGGVPLEALPFDDRNFGWDRKRLGERHDPIPDTVSLALPSWTVESTATDKGADDTRAVSGHRQPRTKYQGEKYFGEFGQSEGDTSESVALPQDVARKSEVTEWDEPEGYSKKQGENSTGKWEGYNLTEAYENDSASEPSLFFEKGKVRVRNWRGKAQKRQEKDG